MELINLFKEEWNVISQAPITFITFGVLVFVFSHLLHRDIIKRLKDQKKIRDDDLAYLKTKTGTEDLKNIADRVAIIEDELENLGETDFLANYIKKRDGISDLPPLP